MSRREEKANPSVLQVKLYPNLTVRNCIAIDNQSRVTFLKEEKIDPRGQTILRKQQILCNTAEIQTLKKYLSLLEYFQMYHVCTKLFFKGFLKYVFPNFKSIYYFYQHDQPKIQLMERNLNLCFTNFSEFEFISQLENCLLVSDNSCEEIINDKEFSKLATTGRRKKC